jgi:hypothetical protein
MDFEYGLSDLGLADISRRCDYQKECEERKPLMESYVG